MKIEEGKLWVRVWPRCDERELEVNP